MSHVPSLSDFLPLAASHNAVPVYRRLIADALTPVVAFARLDDGSPAFLFESVVGGERIGRYSFVSCGPFARFQAAKTTVPEQLGSDIETTTEHPDPLRFLEEKLRQFSTPHLPDLPRFTGGAVGFAGYDTVRYVEHLPNAPSDDRQLPDLRFDFYDRMVIFDHTTKTVLAVALAHIPTSATSENSRTAYADATKRIDELVTRLSEPARGGFLPADLPAKPKGASTVDPRYSVNMPAGGYQAAVRQAKEYILAGDIFQVVLSQRFSTKTTAKPFDVYRALRVVNPSPFMFFVRTEGLSLVGASPEILCRVENGEMTVRPLAGTRMRGANAEQDQLLAAELLADPKELSEHIMLVDLGRNDVGKVCELGSVKLADLMTVEKYSHVMHISSTVTGQLKPGATAFDAMRSALPAGTLSGAPKVRAMEIIDELEPHRRGPYGGAVGYIDFSGNMDTCIALRTMVIQGDMAFIQAGAGIVAESDPDSEHQETVNKAMALMRALEVAEQMFG